MNDEESSGSDDFWFWFILCFILWFMISGC